MAERNLRIVKLSYPMTGLCEHCNAAFVSRSEDPVVAERDVKVRFAEHECNPQESTVDIRRF
jgi:hypothetical protein